MPANFNPSGDVFWADIRQDSVVLQGDPDDIVCDYYAPSTIVEVHQATILPDFYGFCLPGPDGFTFHYFATRAEALTELKKLTGLKVVDNE